MKLTDDEVRELLASSLWGIRGSAVRPLLEELLVLRGIAKSASKFLDDGHVATPNTIALAWEIDAWEKL